MLDIFKTDNAVSKDLILALKSFPMIAAAYETRVRHYSLQQHTELVISDFGDINIPISRNLFRFLLSVHDLGKPKAYQEGNLERQYYHTQYLINQIRSQLPFTPKAIDFCLAIINGDPMGKFMQKKINLATARQEILTTASEATVPLFTFFKTLTIYYQCDVAAYTADAGGVRHLENLFICSGGHKTINAAKGILSFSPIFELKYIQLENALA